MGVLLHIDSELPIPDQINRIDVHVSSDEPAAVLYEHSYALDAGQSFPLTLSLEAGSSKEGEIWIEVIGYLADEAVARDAASALLRQGQEQELILFLGPRSE